MKGILQVYENFGTPNQRMVSEEHNLIVDSAAEIITDMLSTPSSLTVGTGIPNLLDTSNYRVNALSFGKSFEQYQQNAHQFSPTVRNFLSDSNEFAGEGVRVVNWNRNLLSRNYSPPSGEPSAAAYFSETSGGWTSNFSTSAYVSGYGVPSPVGTFLGNTIQPMSAPLSYAQPNILVEAASIPPWLTESNTLKGVQKTASALTFPDLLWTKYTSLGAVSSLTYHGNLPGCYADYMGAHNARQFFVTASSMNWPQNSAQTWNLVNHGLPRSADGSGYILSGIQPEVNTETTYTWSVYYKCSSVPVGHLAELPINEDHILSATLNSTISMQLVASSFSIPGEEYNWWNTIQGYDTNQLGSWTKSNCITVPNASNGPEGSHNSRLFDSTSNGGNALVDYAETGSFSPIGNDITKGRFYVQQLYIKKSLSDPPTAPTRFEVYNKDSGFLKGDGVAVLLDWDGVAGGTSSLNFYRNAKPNETGSDLRGFSLVEKATNGFYRVVIVVPFDELSSAGSARYRLRLYPGGSGGQGSVYVNNYQFFEVPTSQFFTLQFPNGPVTLTRNMSGGKYRTDLMLKNGKEVTPGPPIGDGTTYPYDDTDGTVNVWRRAVHTTTFSSTPHLFEPRLTFGFTRVNDNYQLCNPQVEMGDKATAWSDSSSITLRRGIDEDGLKFISKDSIPMLESGGALEKQLTLSVYANPSGTHAATAGVAMRIVNQADSSGNNARTLTSLTPGNTSYARASHQVTFSGVESPSLGAEIYVSGVSPDEHIQLANAQLEYDGSVKLPEAFLTHTYDTPSTWVSGVTTSTLDVWNQNTELHGDSIGVSSSYPNVVAGPFPGTSGTLILNNSDVSTLCLQQRIVAQNKLGSLTAYSTTPFYDNKVTASIYVKYPFEHPPGVIPQASGSTEGQARRSEIALYPGITSHDVTSLASEFGYENGGRVVLRWTDPDGVQSPGAGSAVIDNDILDGTAADGTLEYVRNGWYRVSVTNKNHSYTYANTSSLVFSVYPVARMYADMHGSPNSASGGLYLYGAQLELGDHATAYEDTTSLYSLTPGPYTDFSGVIPTAIRVRSDTDWSGTFSTSTIYAKQNYHITNSSGVNLLKDNLGFVSDNWVSANTNTVNLGNSIYPPDTNIAPVLYKPTTGESYLRQDVTSSALEDDQTYVLSFFIRRRTAAGPPNGTQFITQMFSPGGDRMATYGWDWQTSSMSGAPVVTGYDRVGTFAADMYPGGTNTFPWWRFYLTYPYKKNDGNGDIRVKLYPWGSDTAVSKKYGGYIAKALLQPADTSSYVPEGFLPDSPNPLDVSLVDDYYPPMASALEFSSTFNQNLNFLTFRDSSAVNVSSFTDVEVVPHRSGGNYATVENDLSGALGLNAYYFGCYPDGSATPNTVSIVSALDTEEAYSNPVATGTFGGYFNQCSAMDPSGFLRVWPNQGENKNLLYLTSGMVTSCTLDFSTTGEVAYIGTIASGDLGMANLYGGITQLGLWGFDTKKLIDAGRLPPYTFWPEAGSNKPIGNELNYKMVCKKVLNRNLTQILDSSGPGLTNYRDLTLVWRLKFL